MPNSTFDRLFYRDGSLSASHLRTLAREAERRSRVYPTQPFVDCGGGLAMLPVSSSSGTGALSWGVASFNAVPTINSTAPGVLTFSGGTLLGSGDSPWAPSSSGWAVSGGTTLIPPADGTYLVGAYAALQYNFVPCNLTRPFFHAPGQGSIALGIQEPGVSAIAYGRAQIMADYNADFLTSVISQAGPSTLVLAANPPTTVSFILDVPPQIFSLTVAGGLQLALGWAMGGLLNNSNGGGVPTYPTATGDPIFLWAVAL